MNYKNKNVLVTGGDGMIGRELCSMLREKGAIVLSGDIKSGFDLRDYSVCMNLCADMDFVFHLAGIKGNPKMTKERPADFMTMLQFDANMIRSAQENKVKRFLYTSSIAVENPETDLYPAKTKLIAELLISAMRIQYPKSTKYCIVRPANVFGFEPLNKFNSMVVTSLISKALNKNSEYLEIWGNGENIRDFIYSKDVARGMIQCIEELPKEPINLCSGIGVTIKEVANIISKLTNKKIKYVKSNEITGDKKRVMKLNWNFKPKYNIEEGIAEVIRQHVE